MQVSRKPDFTLDEALALALDRYGVRAQEVVELPSERDQNFRLVSGCSSDLVLKVSHPDEDRAVLDFQNRALRHLECSPEGSIFPRLRPDSEGFLIGEVRAKGETFCFRLVTYLPGVPLGAASPPDGRLIRDLGRKLGQLDHALASFSHPAMNRHLYWDSRHALETIARNRPFLENSARTTGFEELVTLFRREVEGVASRLRQGVIHNDANDYNVLVDRAERPTRITGIIDFGDLVRTFRICELANCCAYLMMGREDPVEVCVELAGAYHAVYPLATEELQVLFHFIAIRLCLSVSNAARQKQEAPSNVYLTISEGPAWRLLEKLVRTDRNEFTQRLLASCGDLG